MTKVNFYYGSRTPTLNSTLLNMVPPRMTRLAGLLFTFTIADLLGNDPGGAAKVNVDTQFFFGARGSG